MLFAEPTSKAWVAQNTADPGSGREFYVSQTGYNGATEVLLAVLIRPGEILSHHPEITPQLPSQTPDTTWGSSWSPGPPPGIGLFSLAKRPLLQVVLGIHIIQSIAHLHAEPVRRE
jgi:hypothetical protein